MDPELKAEFQEAQKGGGALSALAGGGSQSNALQNFDAAAWLAGSKKDSDKEKEKDKGAAKEKGNKR